MFLLTGMGEMEFSDLWRFFLLTFIRFAPVVFLAPFLGSRKGFPMTARAGMILCLTLVFLPTILYHSPTKHITSMMFYALTAKELLIGFCLGFLASIPFHIAQSAGIIIDYMRGSSMLMTQDPTMEIQTSPIGVLFNYYLIALFYQLDGPLLFYDAVETSFLILPVAEFSPLHFFQNQTFWGAIVGLAGKIFEVSIQIAMPAILGVLMAESFLGIANRLAPQIQIAFLGMSLKSILGLLLLWAGWYLIIKNMSSFSLDWTNWILQTIQTF
ncbi:MAG: hypothetical protein A3F09_00085 [Chlamydiae bacterium RIFCSPHIGHO2_12_FULL_49_11]|nr:MAG: hypothetical protein A3F09_00085 [Chlamydiae bacterium RIFCSPHIGHO2_12_FULL_49_11]